MRYHSIMFVPTFWGAGSSPSLLVVTKYKSLNKPDQYICRGLKSEGVNSQWYNSDFRSMNERLVILY